MPEWRAYICFQKKWRFCICTYVFEQDLYIYLTFFWHKIRHQMRKKQLICWTQSFSSNDYISYTAHRLHAYEWVHMIHFRSPCHLNLCAFKFFLFKSFYFLIFYMTINLTIVFLSSNYRSHGKMLLLWQKSLLYLSSRCCRSYISEL